MRLSAILAILLLLVPLSQAMAQGTAAPAPPAAPPAPLAGTGNFRIVWEVKNRFRLFRNEADFARMAAASRGDGVLAAERRLENATDGLGWARDVVGDLCLDDYGNLVETCERDGVRENYLAPQDHPVGLTLSGPVPAGANCVWSFDSGGGSSTQTTAPCDQEVKLRVPSGRTTVASVDIPLGDGTAQRVSTEIAVRDIFVAGLGDFDRRRRGQSRSRGGIGRRVLLQALSERRLQPVFPAEPRRLQRRSVLRRRTGEPERRERLGPPRRALDEFGLPPLAIQLPGPHHARACNRATAHRGHSGAAGLYRRDHRRRIV